jgi:hypothetical protein
VRGFLLGRSRDGNPKCCLAFIIQDHLSLSTRGIWFGKFSETFSNPREDRKIIDWQLPEHIQTGSGKKYSKIN